MTQGVIALTLILLGTSQTFASDLQKLKPPPEGKLYHGVFAGGPIPNGEEQIKRTYVESYKRQAGTELAWVYFSHAWSCGQSFPVETATMIRDDCGAVPFIRLMLRSSDEREDADDETVYTLANIIDGMHDPALAKWAESAKDFASPLIVEYGTECNGAWFPWNGKHNGGGETQYCDPQKADGPERFQQAYRHIVELMRNKGAANITWVFHVNYHDNAELDDEPDWNKFENYYPGDEWVDWLAVSVYGAQSAEQSWEPATFRESMDDVHKRLQCMAANKKIIVAEFGSTAGYYESHVNRPLFAEQFKPGVWAGAALDDLLGPERRWPNVIGFAWWNEAWTNDKDADHPDPANDTNMCLETVHDLSRAFREKLCRYADSVESTPHVHER
ncbi:MAG: beta-mannanase [Planctomycetota bacterium]|nr:MAG: beta-mannanase [Planctomycetota bacterium]REK21623.1 MAG: beta-mannanase [Planctomycetota bacterium]REK29984.1 MAG: beta-mannanase [Planctomycetota bacterium]